MKKTLCLISALILLITSLSACEFKRDSEKFDIWDGTAASCFSGGDGSESDPYQISSCAELSYLAKEVNNGNSFKGKHFLLTSNLDLNNLEWTPIGNGPNAFSGIFDGADHTIINLKITKQYTYEIPVLDSSFTEAVLGLFGKCQDSALKNLTIADAEIVMKNFSCTSIYSGILVGYMLSEDGNSEISNIKVTSSHINSVGSNTVSLLIGGIAGRINNKSTFKLERLQTQLSVSVKDKAAHENIIGGLFGGLGNKAESDSLNIEDCESDISIAADDENYFLSNNSFGAIGTSTRACHISNVFSKVAVNKLFGYSNGRPEYAANAVIGKIYPENAADKYQFKNLFGYVEQADGETGKKATSTQLYDIPEKWGDIVSEENCLGCTSLPKDHGFSPDIWDLGDLSNPKLK